VLLQILVAFNLFAGLLILLALPASFIFEPAFLAFFTKKAATISPAVMMPALRVWMLFGIVTIAATQIMLMRLIAIVDTVSAGDPFVGENAARLKTIGWCVLAMQLLHLVSGLMARLMNAAGSNIEWQWSGLTGWLAVVLIFVLARVFEEGTSIRADLKAMI
jgi:hypothetical protein